jgi:hypothetical protein
MALKLSRRFIHVFAGSLPGIDIAAPAFVGVFPQKSVFAFLTYLLWKSAPGLFPLLSTEKILPSIKNKFS